MPTMSPSVTIVIPTKNEAANLREVLPKLPLDHEIVLVDGNSVDGTVEVALELRPDTRVVRQTRKGKGNALAAGFLAATGDIGAHCLDVAVGVGTDPHFLPGWGNDQIVDSLQGGLVGQRLAVSAEVRKTLSLALACEAGLAQHTSS